MTATASADAPGPAIALRAPSQVMRLDRLGAMHMSRLSFTRTLVRRARLGNWQVRRTLWDLDRHGHGRAVLAVRIGARDYGLVAFSRELPAELRTDRVIAEAWDTTYVLHDGLPDAAALDRLAATVPHQEACRYTERELILARANKSERLFELVRRALAEGRQPDAAAIRSIGYLLRTTAVYGNGKFGIADHQLLAGRQEFAGPFAAEMLTVWLIRAFMVELVEHCAQHDAPVTAVRLDPALRRQLGVGNSTGLGMAPFLVRHPALIHRWIEARETALARVRRIEPLDPATRTHVLALLDRGLTRIRSWETIDALQAERILGLQRDLATVRDWVAQLEPATRSPWDRLQRRAEAELGLEAQEYLASLLIEPHGELVDDLALTMAAPDVPPVRLDQGPSCGTLRRLLASHCPWAALIDPDDPASSARFWYTSQEKLEPRLGWRGEDEGDALELPLGVGVDLARLARELATRPDELPVAQLADERPLLRHVVRRVLATAGHAYGEIQDNLLAAGIRPIDLMRCKLSFLGAEFFDPRSDLFLRVRLFQDAPFPDELAEATDDPIGW